LTNLRPSFSIYCKLPAAIWPVRLRITNASYCPGVSRSIPDSIFETTVIFTSAAFASGFRFARRAAPLLNATRVPNRPCSHRSAQIAVGKGFSWQNPVLVRFSAASPSAGTFYTSATLYAIFFSFTACSGRRASMAFTPSLPSSGYIVQRYYRFFSLVPCGLLPPVSSTFPLEDTPYPVWRRPGLLVTL